MGLCDAKLGPDFCSRILKIQNPARWTSPRTISTLASRRGNKTGTRERSGGRRRRVAGTLEGARSQQGADSRTRPSPRPRAPTCAGASPQDGGRLSGPSEAGGVGPVAPALKGPARPGALSPARLYHKKVRAARGSAPGGGGGASARTPRGLRVLAEAQPSGLPPCAALEPRLQPRALAALALDGGASPQEAASEWLSSLRWGD